MSSEPRIYLAGPGVFDEDAVASGEALKTACARFGIEGVHPLDGPPLSGAHEIYEANVGKIRRCDAVLADLRGFRGPHADDGTSFEVGFAVALGKPVFAYDPGLATLRDRIPAARVLEDGRVFDAEGLQIEDFGLPHNLMLACSVECVARSAEDAIAYAAARLKRD